MSGYRPEASAVSDGAMAAWLAEALLPESVTSVPGVGPKTAEALAKVGVLTPHQLMGKFLCLRSPGLGCKPLCDAFYAWLKDSGVNANRSTIVMAVAEKATVWVPGLYYAEECTEAAEDEAT